MVRLRDLEPRMPPVYMVRMTDRWGEGTADDGMRYLCLQAMNKKEVSRYLRGYKNLSAARVKICDELRLWVQQSGQEVRKAVFDGATRPEDLDRIMPGWRWRDEVDKFSR